MNTLPNPNLDVYNESDVVAYYAALDKLTPCEKVLFQTFIRPGAEVLDLGVGGGRTTPYLSGVARRYVGIDYAQEMINTCRRKFPDLEFRIVDASDLATFNAGTFDVVVFAFNGIDYLTPDKARHRCLSEVHRVLKDDGIFIFSTHNPRAIFVRPWWNAKRAEALARQLSARSKRLFILLHACLTGMGVMLSCLRSLGWSIKRVLRRLPAYAFWRGEGYMIDAVHGGLVTHYAVPKRIVSELQGFGFHLLQVQGHDHPLRTGLHVTDWYYYVFGKVSGMAGDSGRPKSSFKFIPTR
jgi:SAM-dependent methyltransferase